MGREAGGPHGGDQDDLLGDGVEDGHDRRAGHHRVGQVQRVRVHVRQLLGQADHVVTQGAEQAGGHGRQPRGQVEARGGHQIAQGVQRRLGLRRELAAGDGVSASDLGLVPAAAPDEVGLHGDDGVPAAPGAALNGLEQEGVGASVADLQIGGDRRLQVVHQPRPDHLGLSVRVGALKAVVGRFDHDGTGG